MNTIESLLTYLESQGHGVTARELRALLEAERSETRKMVEQIADEAHNRKLELDMWLYLHPDVRRASSKATGNVIVERRDASVPGGNDVPPRVTAEDWDKIHAMLAEAQAVGENLDAVRSRFGLETPPPADPIAAIRARHDAVEQRRSWASTVVTSDGEQAHRDRGELLEALEAVIGEVEYHERSLGLEPSAHVRNKPYQRLDRVIDRFIQRGEVVHQLRPRSEHRANLNALWWRVDTDDYGVAGIAGPHVGREPLQDSTHWSPLPYPIVPGGER